MLDARPLRVAIVGSGPSGMYAAGHLLESPAGTFFEHGLTKRVRHPISVDVIDRLPTPWGLIRGGVAPDHLDKKKIASIYEAIARRPGFRFIGNIQVGADVSVSELATWYDAVIYAIGCDGERRLSIPGEGLAGSCSAHRFVGWYNGQPDFSHQTFDLQTDRAVIVGNGNVAMDIARILLKSVDELQKTDIASHALKALEKSTIREVVILGRRGPKDAAFNFPELEELGELHDTAIVVEGGSALTQLSSNHCNGTNLETLRALCARQRTGRRRIVLRFDTSPLAVLGGSHVTGVRVASEGVEDEIKCGLLIAAIGYRGTALPGLPFDDIRGTIPSHEGRVIDSGKPVTGAYVAGWIRRGPRGIIGSNKKCARDAVMALLTDFELDRLPRLGTLAGDDVLARLRQQVPGATSFDHWKRIDQVERALGSNFARPRIKLTSLDELLKV